MKHISKFCKVAQRTLLGALSTLVLLLAGISEAKATHLASADIDAQFIGARPQQGFCGQFQTQYMYKLTIKLYRACEQGSADLPTTAPFTVYSPSGCNAAVTGVATLISADTLDQLCDQYKPLNSCKLGGRNEPYPYPGFIRHVFEATVSLPTACPDWTFYWESSARNGAILNLVGAGGTGLFVSCMVNNAASDTNSTPKFTTLPIPFICVGKPAFFLNGPTDVDGNRIEVIPYKARQFNALSPTRTADIPYAGAYSAANPVNSPASNPYTVNPLTGTATFTGPIQGKYVLTFRANEYNSSGTLIGYTERDVQVSVLPCAITAPVLDPTPTDITGGNIIVITPAENVVTICPGSELSMTFKGKSATGGAVLVLNSNKDIATPGATLDVTGQYTDNLSGLFKWTPKKSDVGAHTLIVTLTDSSCNIGGQSILQQSNVVVSILVPGDIDAGPDGFYCPNPDGPPFQINASSPTVTPYTWTTVPGGSSENTLSCTDCLRPTARPDSPTDYIIEAVGSPYICKLRDTVRVNTNNAKITQGPEVVLCRPGTLELDALAIGLPPKQIIVCGGTEVANCTDPDSVTIGNCTNASPAATVNPFYTQAVTQKSQILYRRDELRANGVLPQTLKKIGFFIDAVNNAFPIRNLSIGMKCTQKQDLNVGVRAFDTAVKSVFSTAGPLTLTQGWNYFTLDSNFNYDTSQNLLIDICFSNLSASNQSASIQFSPTAYFAIIQRNAPSGSICNQTAPASAFTTTQNRPNIKLFGCLPAEKPFLYKWTPGDFLVDSTGSATSAYVPKSIKYYVEVEGLNGCIVKDSVDIIVPTDTITVNPKDSLICPGELAIIQATKSPYETYKWYEGDFQPATSLDCDTCDRVLARPKVDTRYTVVGSITYGNLIRKACPDTSVADVRLRLPAVIKVDPKDTTIKAGQRVVLTAIGGDRYSWTPENGGLNSNAGPRVIAQPLESTTYIVEGLDTNGCRGNDTTVVNINYRQTLFVPTAFTPNGDDNNDVFNVVNLTVQKIIEFRVFNRWGQEVFSTTDSRQGWDGTWKGVPQQTGSYNYIIRVAYPDGITDTFKGEVTLIR